jgi:transketolase
MSAFVKSEHTPEADAMRDVYARTLTALAKSDKRVFALDADLANSMGMTPFFEQFPEQSLDCGVQEANMIGIAAGLSLTGKIPFAHTFGPFATRRVMDQVFLSCAYAELNVKIIGSDPGITAAFNGATHMPFEDMSVMCAIPGVTVLEPSDSVMLESILKRIKDVYGIHYVRLQRKNANAIYEKQANFTVGKGIVLRDGNDLTIIASGIMVKEALDAAVILANEGLSARVVDMFTWKPLDEALILKCARETGAIVTAENHNATCGLGARIAQVTARNCPVPMEFTGVNDEFGEVGSQSYLRERYKLTAEEISAKAKIVFANKRKGMKF